MLFQQFPIRYRRPDKTPIQLFLADRRLLISCHFQFSGNMLRLRPEGCDQTYAELVADGIRTFWSGDYWLPMPQGPQFVRVEVQITSGPRRRAAAIRLRQMLFMPPHVSSPWHRRFWGLFRTGQLESIGENWSREHPGAMILPHMTNPELIRRIAAHEAGHLFGIGDAYGAIYRFYDAAPGTERYMMHANWEVQPAEILMMLRAHMANKMQFFPRRFQWTRFREGFRADLRQRLAEAEARLEARREARRRQRRLKKGPTGPDTPAEPGEPAVAPAPVVEAAPSVDNGDTGPGQAQAPSSGPMHTAEPAVPPIGPAGQSIEIDTAGPPPASGAEDPANPSIPGRSP